MVEISLPWLLDQRVSRQQLGSLIAKRGESGQGWQVRRYAGTTVLFHFTWPWWYDALRPTINVSNWTYIAAVWGGGYRKIFVNGALEASEIRNGAVNVTNSALFSVPRTPPEITTPPLRTSEVMEVSGLMTFAFIMHLSDTEVEQIYGGGMGDVGQPWIVVNSPTAATAATAWYLLTR